jgi:sigma-E factor negative regulatory protein RseC
MSSRIEHKGTVSQITDNIISVKFTAESACTACHAKGVCGAAEMEDKSVEIVHPAGRFEIGETVRVVLSQNLGYRALLFGYLFPFMLVVVVLIAMLSFTNELLAGLTSLVILIPYYLLLYIKRGSLRKQFRFFLEKI